MSNISVWAKQLIWCWMNGLDDCFILAICFYLENFFLNRKVWRIKNTHYSNEPLVTFFHICFRFLLKETKHSRLIWPFVLYPTPILLYLSSEVSTIMKLLWMHFVPSSFLSFFLSFLLSFFFQTDKELRVRQECIDAHWFQSIFNLSGRGTFAAGFLDHSRKVDHEKETSVWGKKRCYFVDRLRIWMESTLPDYLAKGELLCRTRMLTGREWPKFVLRANKGGCELRSLPVSQQRSAADQEERDGFALRSPRAHF